MADSKYGRLFTEMDVRAAISEAYRRGRDGELVSWHPGFEADVIARLQATFPADEPLFLLRGQDLAAPDAIATGIGGGDPAVTVTDYLASATEQGATPEFLQRVTNAALEMKQWQLEHPDRVHTPD